MLEEGNIETIRTGSFLFAKIDNGFPNFFLRKFLQKIRSILIRKSIIGKPFEERPLWEILTIKVNVEIDNSPFFRRSVIKTHAIHTNASNGIKFSPEISQSVKILSISITFKNPMLLSPLSPKGIQPLPS